MNSFLEEGIYLINVRAKIIVMCHMYISSNYYYSNASKPTHEEKLHWKKEHDKMFQSQNENIVQNYPSCYLLQFMKCRSCLMLNWDCMALYCILRLCIRVFLLLFFIKCMALACVEASLAQNYLSE